MAGRMATLDTGLQAEALLELRVQDVLCSARLEGEEPDPVQLHSFVAGYFGQGPSAIAEEKEPLAAMMLDLTRQYDKPLTADRLRFHTLTRNRFLSGEMKNFLKWFNGDADSDPVLKAAIACLWFITIHPLDKKNGSVALALAAMQLCRAEDSPQRWYSLPAQILRERELYQEILKKTKKGLPDTMVWLEWFLSCLDRALAATDEMLAPIFRKAGFRDKLAAMPFNVRQRSMIDALLKGREDRLTSSRWAQLTDCSQDTALRDIQDLIDQKVLVKDAGGGRSTGYILAGAGL